MSSRLSPQARRLRTIIISAPIMGATAFVLYKRLILGEPQRTLPRPSSSSPNSAQMHRRLVPIKPQSYEDEPVRREEVWVPGERTTRRDA